MSDVIIVALISLVGTILTQWWSHRSTIAKMEKNSELADQQLKGQIAVIENKIETLSERVNKHNNLIERTYALERRNDVLDERIQSIARRVNDMENDGK